MALLEKWTKMAYNEQEDKNKLQKLWADYFEVEKGIYQKLLADPDTVVTGTVAELAEKYETDIMTMTGLKSCYDAIECMKNGETLLVMLDAIANEGESMRCQDMPYRKLRAATLFLRYTVRQTTATCTENGIKSPHLRK